GHRRPVCSADVPFVQPIVLSPAGHGRGAVGLMAGMGRKARWRGRVFFTRTELGKIWWWWQCAWPFVICELAVEQCGKGRLFFLYSDEFVDTEIDFLKIDVEGGEKNVLLGADYKKYRPRIILIEATIPFDDEGNTSAKPAPTDRGKRQPGKQANTGGKEKRLQKSSQPNATSGALASAFAKAKGRK
ncbi:MAG: FkbM family methyltransferase, partial [bacterium]|nr:FkbM family methyltransferase [bacterium]